MNPEYVILDEPTAGLDRRSRKAVTGAIRRMAGGKGAGGGATVVCISHRIKEVLEVADRIAKLSAGKLAFEGTNAAYRDRM
jgi:ABC-type multidrug transport system ATPase subunit